MRAKVITPVDTIGCAIIPILVSEKIGISKYELLPKNYRLQLLLALILSAQTKDEVVGQAMLNIIQYCAYELKCKEGITLDSRLKINEDKLAELIKQTVFYRKKASYLKRIVQLLLDKFGFDITTEFT